MDCQIDVRFFPAPPDLAGCFATFYRAEFKIADGERVRDLLLPECAKPGGDRVSGARFTATGPSMVSASFELGTTRMWGIGFFPLGWAKFCSAPACELANRIIDGEKHSAFGGFAGLTTKQNKNKPHNKHKNKRVLACVRALNREVPDEERI